MIDITKLGIHPNPSGVRTRDGREVRIYSTDGGGAYPIHGATISGACWVVEAWTKDGQTFDENDINTADPGDLLPIPQKLVGWVNVLKGRRGNIFTDHVYDNEEEAKLQINHPEYVDTIRIEYEPKDAP